MKLSLCIVNSASEDSSGADDNGNNTTDYPSLDTERITAILREELEVLCPPSKLYENAEISLTFTPPEGIRELNREYRGVDEATDVLSFPLLEDEAVEVPELPVLALGDIVICPEETERLHPELSREDAIILMIAHSFLHLLGYDHDTDEKQAEMWELQEKIAAKIHGRTE